MLAESAVQHQAAVLAESFAQSDRLPELIQQAEPTSLLECEDHQSSGIGSEIYYAEAVHVRAL